jgi:hypothetical protein
MFEERTVISQVEAASPEELANILVRPSLDEEKALVDRLKSFPGNVRQESRPALSR